MEVDSLSSKHFEARDIKAILDIDKNKLFYWIKTHRLLKPEIEEASGTGSKAKFSLKNLLEIAMIKEMINFGFELKAIKEIKEKVDKLTSSEDGAINIFDDILSEEGLFKDEMRSEEALYIYKSKDTVHLIQKTYTIDGDFDGDGWVPIPVPDYIEYDEKNNQNRPPMYVAIKIDLGDLALDLIKKLKKR